MMQKVSRTNRSPRSWRQPNRHHVVTRMRKARGGNCDKQVVAGVVLRPAWAGLQCIENHVVDRQGNRVRFDSPVRISDRVGRSR